MLEEITGLQVNNSFYKKGGVIGRANYLKNNLIIGIIPLTLKVILGGLDKASIAQSGQALPDAVWICWFIGCIPFYYLGIQNAFKRLRDSKGEEISMTTKSTYAVLLAIPGINFIIGLSLLFSGSKRKDKVIPNSTVIKTCETEDSKLSNNYASNNHNSTPNDEKINRLEKIIALKDKGLISNEEFTVLKEEIFKKAS
jgi:hypothetical protein